MDPLSFTASIVTLLGVVTASSNTIYDICKRLKNASKNVQTLLEQLRTFEDLLKELNKELQAHKNNASQQETLQEVWGSTLDQMRRDIEGLRVIASKIEPLAKTRSLGSRVSLSAREMLSEKDIKKYQKQIEAHCGKLMSIQTMVCGRKLDQLSQNITKLGNEDIPVLQRAYSQLSQATVNLGNESKSGANAVISQVTSLELSNRRMHQTTLDALNDHAQNADCSGSILNRISEQQTRVTDVHEAGFQAVSAKLGRMGYQLQQIQKDQIAFGTVRQGGPSPSNQPIRSNLMTSEATVFWRYDFYCLPVGTLQISLHQVLHKENSRELTSSDLSESTIKVTFTPPRWLSRSTIEYTAKLCCDLVTSQWHWGVTLTPLTVNHDPLFIEALKNYDVEGLRQCFRTGKARPNDYVDGCYRYYNRGLVPWFEAFGLDVVAKDMAIEQKGRMLEFMIEEGLPGQGYVFNEISTPSEMLGPTPHKVLRSNMQIYLKHDGKLFTDQSDSRLVRQVFMGPAMANALSIISWIPELMIRSSEIWMVDDLTPYEICLIGILAHADFAFRDILKLHLGSCRSPFYTNCISTADRLYERHFGTDSILYHYNKLHHCSQYDVLRAVCGDGSVPMLQFLIDVGIDIAPSCLPYHPPFYYRSLLGIAAISQNWDNFKFLVRTGSDCAEGLAFFLKWERGISSDSLYKHVVELCTENAAPLNHDYNDAIHTEDPLTAILSPHGIRALSLYPELVEILVDRQVFHHELLFGEESNKPPFQRSYMAAAITMNYADIVNLFLKNGVQANTRIADSFSNETKVGDNWRTTFLEGSTWPIFVPPYDSTWLILSVWYGSANCVEELIRHGANITALDGTGRSAIRLARAKVQEPYRHSMKRWRSDNGSYSWCDHSTVEADIEILAILKQAFNLKFKGSKNFDDYEDDTLGLINNPQVREERRSRLSDRVCSIFTSSPSIRYWYYTIRRLWKMPFHEALLMRFFYVLSYCLLLATEVLAFTTGAKRFRRPSRSILSAVAVLILVLVWGYGRDK